MLRLSVSPPPQTPYSTKEYLSHLYVRRCLNLAFINSVLRHTGQAVAWLPCHTSLVTGHKNNIRNFSVQALQESHSHGYVWRHIKRDTHFCYKCASVLISCLCEEVSSAGSKRCVVWFVGRNVHEPSAVADKSVGSKPMFFVSSNSGVYSEWREIRGYRSGIDEDWSFLGMRSGLFCDITQRRVAILYRRFGTSYGPHL
jgi:hypothetical protein